jgi:hypothetical protein
MPFVDLSQGVPAEARLIRLRFGMRTRKAGEPLLAKVWSGDSTKGILLKGERGEAVIRLDVPQTLSYEHADGIDLTLKVVAYNLSE